jgi:diphosphomevalonate decarboxylase
MHNHPFAERRFAQAHENLDALITIFESGDLERLSKL